MWLVLVEMEDLQRIRLEYLQVMAENDLIINRLNIYRYLRGRRRWRRGQRGRRQWTRGWILRRRKFGLYDQLMVELRREDRPAFENFMRMPPELYDEVLLRIEHRLTKQYTFFREPLEPGLKLAITLRHLASGAKYSDMKFAWRVPHNTISIIVREVCQAIINEYSEEMLTTPYSPRMWLPVAQRFYQRWNFPHCLGALDGKHVACKKPSHSGSTYYNYKKFFSIILMALVDADYKFLWIDVGGMYLQFKLSMFAFDLIHIF